LPGKPLPPPVDVFLPASSTSPRGHDTSASLPGNKQSSPWSTYKSHNHNAFEHTAAAIVAAPTPSSLLDLLAKRPESPTTNYIGLKKEKAVVPEFQDWRYVYTSGRRAASVKVLQKQISKLDGWKSSIAQIRSHHHAGEYQKAIELHKNLKAVVHQDMRDIEKDRAFKRFMFPTNKVAPPTMSEINENMQQWQTKATEAATPLAKARIDDAIQKHFPGHLSPKLPIHHHSSSHGQQHQAISAYKQEIRKYRS
jgi:hypothetical protein